MVAAPADAADRATLAGGAGSGAKRSAHRLVDGASVRGFARELRHHGLHHLAHVLRRRGAGFGDRGGHGGRDLFRRGTRRQVLLEDLQLAGFLVDQVLAAGVGELLDRVAPLLHQRRHDLQYFGVVEILLLLHALVHDGGLQHAERREAHLILGFHRGGDLAVDLFVERHGFAAFLVRPWSFVLSSWSVRGPPTFSLVVPDPRRDKGPWTDQEPRTEYQGPTRASGPGPSHRR